MFQRGQRRYRQVGDKIIGVEPGNVPRRLFPEFIVNPSGNPAQLFVIIVHCRDDICDYFYVHIPFCFRPLCHIENTAPVGYLRQIAIKRVGITFNVHPPGIQIRPDGI